MTEFIAELNIDNEYGFLSVECRSDKGVVIGVLDNKVATMPPNHIALSKSEALKLARWLADWINKTE